MDELENQIKDLSIKYTLNTDKNYLKKFGQFFTLSSDILLKLIDTEHLDNLDILEPSCGTGIIILECMKKFKNFNLDAIEIDKNVYTKTLDLFKQHSNVKFINSDFLKYNFDGKKYDLIIGNPPYFELAKDVKMSINDDFKDIVSGRTNIYSLFIFKSIKLLKKNGQLIFIIPKTILSGKYFSKLREYIHKHCYILDIIKFDNSNLFKKALQSVIILKLQLRDLRDINNEKNNYILKINKELYFVKDKEELKIDVETTTISDLNCIVKTGNIVWNQHKELLSNNKTENTLRVIMASNIKSGKLIIKENTDVLIEKKQYMTINDLNRHLIISGPYILINRIVGLNPPRLNIYFEKSNNNESKCFIENHVNFIKGPLENLTRIYNSLNNNFTVKFIKELIGNTQLSQNELENIIPII